MLFFKGTAVLRSTVPIATSAHHDAVMMGVGLAGMVTLEGDSRILTTAAQVAGHGKYDAEFGLGSS